MTDGTYEGLTDEEILVHLALSRPAPGTADPETAGPIHPAYARDLAADLGAAHWRYVLTDHEGRYLTSGLTTARPIGAKLRSWRSQAVVELQIPITLLTSFVDGELTHRHLAEPARLNAWAAVVADIARRADMQPNAPPGDGTDDPRRRFPRAALRRAVQIRKRHCIGVGCRAPASTTDIDHVHDHARGGPTVDWNLDPNCRHDHTLKHKGRWTLRLIGPNSYLWTSRLGHTYRVDVPPIIEDLPDPDPPATTRSSPPGHPAPDAAPTANPGRNPPPG